MSIVFIDKGIKEFDDLYNELSKTHLVYLLDDKKNSFTQISELISHNSNLGSIHIFSHGSPGILQFLSGSISSDNLLNYDQEIQSISNSLGPNGNIHLYGCNVGQGDKGLEFINLFSSISNLDIAASDDVSAPKFLNGDWDLEVKTGEIHQASIIPSSFKGSLGAPSISNLDTNIAYTENAGLGALDTDITISGGTTTAGDKYEGGWIEFSLSTAQTTDILKFTDDGSASTVNGQVSIVNSIIYVGNGTGAAILGNVDSTKNGLNGNALRVNISNKFQNGNFETNDGSSQFGNWQIYDSGPIYFGTTKIDGLDTPTDTTPPKSGIPISDQNVPTEVGSYSGAVNDDGGGEYSVRLTSGSPNKIIAKKGYDIVRGPALYSDNTVYLRANDQVSFDWKASGGRDAFDVYGYIVNVNDNSFLKILDETGTSASATTSWATETATVTAEGSYKFVFVAGTFDFSGGKWAGAQLFVDNVTVTENVAPPTISDSMVQSIAQRVKFESTSEDPPASKTLTVKTTNLNNAGAEQTGTATATINFTKLNDAPSITSSNTASIDENLPITTVVYDGNATDVDSSDTITFSISGTDAALFTVDSNNGEVKLKTSADFETKNSYSFNIVATDNGAGTLSTSKAVTLSVNNLNDPPSITSGATGTIAENSSISTIAYDAQAIDPDGNSITFSITGTDASLFTIDSDDGEVRLKNSANFEIKNSYSINVVATDNGSTPANSTKAITINVNDQNDNPAVVNDTAITTLNTAKNNIAVLANDSDEDGDTLNIQSISYSGAGNATTNGTIINYTPPTGVATLTETITYVSSDGNGGTSNGTLTMKVVTPLIQGPSNSAGSETSAVTKNENITAVTNLTANVPVTWSINSGLDGDKFNLDAGGNLTFKVAPNFEIPTDADNNNTYQVEVKAVEGGGFFSTQIITVTIQNVNEAPPVIDTTNLTGSVSENNSISEVIYDVTATDADVNDVLTFSVSGTDASLVTIDSDDGEVRLKSSADFENKNSYNFKVIATDPDGSQATESITVNVTNANDQPVVTSSSTATLVENLSNSTVFYKITATDQDTGDNISFSISGDDASLIEVDTDDGELRLKTSADFENKSSYSFNVIATDNGVGNLSAQKAVTLNITNANDAPILKKSIMNIVVNENTSGGYDFNDTFSDPDDDVMTLSARLSSGSVLPGWITFDTTTNFLTITPTRSELLGANVEITANDGNGGTFSDQFIIKVNPSNTPAFGGITITGEKSFDKIITAAASISDTEGLGTFNYQWFSDGIKVQDSNSNNYKILASDLGKKIKVVVNFVDGFGFAESISSDEIKIDLPVKIVANAGLGNRNVFKDSHSQIVLKGGDTDDILVATGGNSEIIGGNGSDVVIGGTGNNPLSGNAHNDFLIGDLLLSEFFLGDDVLNGGPGNDLIEGGNGNDTFVFEPSSGNDTVAKFQLNLLNLSESKPIGRDFEIGKDKIDLKAFGYKEFSEVESKLENNSDGFAVFHDQESSFLIYGVSVNELSIQDFILI